MGSGWSKRLSRSSEGTLLTAKLRGLNGLKPTQSMELVQRISLHACLRDGSHHRYLLPAECRPRGLKRANAQQANSAQDENRAAQ
eukprot:12408532-Karenia_brevis.AAC.1